MRFENVRDDGPIDSPEVALILRRLDQDLAEVLGRDALFCVVLAEVRADSTHVQAVTNTSEPEAREMLYAALTRGFPERGPP